jgi:ketosteroid isomerase-like protein
MVALPDHAVLAAREALVFSHVAAENARDIEAVMATFGHPRYEIVPTGVVHDGDAAVRAMLEEQWAQLPGLRYEAVAFFHGSDGVMVETRTLGTATDGRAVDVVSVNLFGFRDLELVLERCWFDRMTVAEALGYAPKVGER